MHCRLFTSCKCCLVAAVFRAFKNSYVHGMLERWWKESMLCLTVYYDSPGGGIKAFVYCAGIMETL